MRIENAGNALGTVYCGTCGEQNPAKAVFCWKCGKSLVKDASQVASQQGQQKSDAGFSAARDRVQKQEESKRSGMWLIVLIAFLLVGVIAVVGIIARYSAARALPSPAAPTATPAPTRTSVPVPTVPSTPTRIVTATPLLAPASTPSPTRPAATPTPGPWPQTQRIGPMWDSGHKSEYSLEVTMQSVEWFKQTTYWKPKPGYIYLVAHMSVTNLGPGTLTGFGINSFQTKDAKGALRGYAILSEEIAPCRFDSVSLIAGGSIEGCATFEVPIADKLEVIYAPFQYEALSPGRYVSFVVREN